MLKEVMHLSKLEDEKKKGTINLDFLKRNKQKQNEMESQSKVIPAPTKLQNQEALSLSTKLDSPRKVKNSNVIEVVPKNLQIKQDENKLKLKDDKLLAPVKTLKPLGGLPPVQLNGNSKSRGNLLPSINSPSLVPTMAPNGRESQNTLSNKHMSDIRTLANNQMSTADITSNYNQSTRNNGTISTLSPKRMNEDVQINTLKMGVQYSTINTNDK